MLQRLVRCASVLVLLAVLTPRSAYADGVADEAELQFQLGTERYRSGDFRGALEHFLASNRLVPNRNVVFNIARAFERLERYPDAFRYYNDALSSTPPEAMRRELTEAIERIRPNVAVLDVQTTPEGANVFIDRRDLGSLGRSPKLVAVAAGSYRVIAELEGYEPATSESLDVRLGQTVPVRLQLTRIVGRLNISGERGASVRVDDEGAEVACTIPCELDLPPGPHTLYVSREGFQILPRQVNVVAREAQSIRITLTALTGSLVVDADEEDALVEVDGRAVGFTPAVVPNVPVGNRTVRVSLRGFTPLEREVEVRAGQQTELEGLRLVPLREVTAASRFTESVEEAPSSVSIVSPQELDAFGFPTIVEALRGLRGVALSFDSVYASIAVRGLGQPNDYGNRLLLLADGQPLNDNILASAYIGYDGRTDLGDVDRIELVRGAGSVLYGTGAVSGVVNLVTRGRDLPTSVHAGMSAYDNGVARGRVGFHLNLGDDRGVWMSVAGARSAGRRVTIDVPGDMGDEATTVSGFDAFDSGTLTGRAWWGPLTLQWFGTSRSQAIPTGAYEVILDDSRNRFTDSRTMAELRFEPKLSERIQLLTRAYANTYYFNGDFVFEAEDPGGPDEQSVETYHGTWFGTEARLVYSDADSLRLTGGAELQFNTEVTQEAYSRTVGTTERETYLDAREPYLVVAGYALAEADLTSWLRATAGLRLDSYGRLGSDSNRVSTLSLNPRVTFVARATRNDTIKLMAGRAFRAPSAYEFYYEDDGVTTEPSNINGETLRPETVVTAELEYTHRFDADWIAIGALHFGYADSIIETVPVDPMDPESAGYYRNSDTPIVTLGSDVEVRREFRQGWMLAASYGFQSSRYAEDPSAGIPGNRRVANAPEHFASMRAIVPLLSRDLSLATRVSLEGPRRINLASGERTDGAVVADLVLSGEASMYGVRYAFGVYNVFDWRYAVPVGDNFTSRVMPQIGRAFMANVSIKY